MLSEFGMAQVRAKALNNYSEGIVLVQLRGIPLYMTEIYQSHQSINVTELKQTYAKS